MLGEGQILGQVRDAYQGAVACGAVGPIFHDLFQNAIRVGKLVRSETGLDQGRLSVASVAVDVARQVFDHFGDKTVLVIGAGKMADLTLQHLAALRPGRILIANRNPERADRAAQRWNGRAVPFEALNSWLIEADVVVSTTAADEPIVTKEQYARVQQARRNRLSLILDIAVPRDFEPGVGTLDRVMLYNVDDLRAQVERNLSGRKKGVDPARAIIERETALCVANLKHLRHAGTLLRQLGDYADAVRLRELERFDASCPDLTASPARGRRAPGAPPSKPVPPPPEIGPSLGREGGCGSVPLLDQGGPAPVWVGGWRLNRQDARASRIRGKRFHRRERGERGEKREQDGDFKREKRGGDLTAESAENAERRGSRIEISRERNGDFPGLRFPGPLHLSGLFFSPAFSPLPPFLFSRILSAISAFSAVKSPLSLLGRTKFGVRGRWVDEPP